MVGRNPPEKAQLPFENPRQSVFIRDCQLQRSGWGRFHSRFSWPQLYGSFQLDFVNYSEQQWWRQSPALDLVPALPTKKQLEDTVPAVKKLGADVPFGAVSGVSGVVKMVRLIGIRSSVPGVQLVARASRNASTDEMAMYFRRNTDACKTDNILSQALVGRTPIMALLNSAVNETDAPVVLYR